MRENSGVMPSEWDNELSFYLNGEAVRIVNPNPRLPLIGFLRGGIKRLNGTKVGCSEGGCGACTVVISWRCQPQSQQLDQSKLEWTHRAVNACLIPLCTLHGMIVTTVEGIGSYKKGYHAIQKRLVECHGTQCGFCTPGFVMSMYAQLCSKGETLTERDVEIAVDGNLCRCTGYRPILHALKSFVVQKNASTTSILPDGNDAKVGNFVEEPCKMNCNTCESEACSDVEDIALYPRSFPKYDAGSDTPVPTDYAPPPLRPLHFREEKHGVHWYRPISMEQLKQLMTTHNTDHGDLTFVCGSTSKGVTKYFNATAPYDRPDEGRVMVDIRMVDDLQRVCETSQALEVGGAVALTDVCKVLRSSVDKVSKESPWSQAAQHLERVACTQVRNIASWAGNLAILKKYNNFPSDVAVVLMALDAHVSLLSLDGKLLEDVTIEDYLSSTNNGTVLLTKMRIPKYDTASGHPSVFRSTKVAQRSQNSHAHVNSGIFLELANDSSQKTFRTVRIVFGGVSKKPFRCTRAEEILLKGSLTNEVLQKAFRAAEEDLLNVGLTEAFGSAEFRISVMKGLLYKAVLSVVPAWSSSRSQSTVLSTERNSSSGTQAFKICRDTAPVSLPIPKLEGLKQAAGEAIYLDDQRLSRDTLFGALVYTTEPLKIVKNIDIAPAMKMPGVVDVLTAFDITGLNSVQNPEGDEYLFVPIGGVSKCIGAPIGVVLAKSAHCARDAVSQVRIEYADGVNERRPIFCLDDAIQAHALLPALDSLPNPQILQVGNVEEALEAAEHVVEGELYLGAQKHFYMEPQGAIARPLDDAIVKIDSSTQHPDFVQKHVSKVLGVAMKYVIVRVNKVGGGFGGKLSRCIINAAAAAVGCLKHNVPVHVVNDRTTDFRVVGGREPMKGWYRVGYTSRGKLTAVDMKLYVEAGCTYDYSVDAAWMGLMWGDNAYHAPNYRLEAWVYQTDVLSCTPLRAPGVPQSIMILESALEHIAFALNKEISTIQEMNFYRDGQTTPSGQVMSDVKLLTVWDGLKKSVHYPNVQKMIEQFNASHRWKKRGVAMTPTKYGMSYKTRKDGAILRIFAGDGTVMIAHGGCEIGQGINTKVAQVAALTLDIPIDYISIRTTDTDQVPNSECTGGSATSESICRSVIDACKTINSALATIREDNPHADWKKLVQLAHEAGIKLYTDSQACESRLDADTFDYFVYAAACSVVEIDTLTGELQILSSEIHYDCGISLNPAVDIGQIEGGFVMGLGLYLFEEVVYSEKGELLTQGSWEYKIPCAQDIPVNFKVNLLENSNNPFGILNSKATGEPSYALANSVYFAVKSAIKQARKENGVNEHFQLNIPATPSRIQQACRNSDNLFCI